MQGVIARPGSQTDCTTNSIFCGMKILARTLLWLFVFLFGRGKSSAASGSSKIVLGYASMVARTSFIWIAKEQGFFAKYGIDPELILISRGPVLIADSPSRTSIFATLPPSSIPAAATTAWNSLVALRAPPYLCRS
jgi:ABC-type nitrate/sulfonate/bicarbonate transport system substrate-binding protein